MNHKWDTSAELGMEIALALLRGPAHLRAIAGLLGAPPLTVQRKLNELAGAGVLDFRTEGRNKVFFLKSGMQARSYVLRAEQYKLARLIRKYPEMGVIMNDVAARAGGGMVLLFGSYAKFSAKNDSDIDIYIEDGSRKFRSEIEAVNSRISVKSGPFDLGSDLIMEIIKNHVIIKGAEEFYAKTGFLG